MTCNVYSMLNLLQTNCLSKSLIVGTRDCGQWVRFGMPTISNCGQWVRFGTVCPQSVTVALGTSGQMRQWATAGREDRNLLNIIQSSLR